MRDLANASKKYVIKICLPFKKTTHTQTKLFIWMDTIKKSRFPSMNKIFKAPKISQELQRKISN